MKEAEKQTRDLLNDIEAAPDDEQIFKEESVLKSTKMERLQNDTYDLLNRILELRRRNNKNHPGFNNYRP